MFYKVFKKKIFDIYISTTIFKNNLEIDFLPRICYRKQKFPIYHNLERYNIERVIIFSWLICYLSITIDSK